MISISFYLLISTVLQSLCKYQLESVIFAPSFNVCVLYPSVCSSTNSHSICNAPSTVLKSWHNKNRIILMKYIYKQCTEIHVLKCPVVSSLRLPRSSVETPLSCIPIILPIDNLNITYCTVLHNISLRELRFLLH
jgi:hypothetical protein